MTRQLSIEMKNVEFYYEVSPIIIDTFNKMDGILQGVIELNGEKRGDYDIEMGIG